MLEVRDKTFTYSKVKNGVEEKTGALNFDFYEVFITMEGIKEFSLTFNGNKRKFDFRCKDEKEAKEWFDCISMHIN